MSKVFTEYGFIEIDGNYLMHHGILGMHWGIRRYQKYGEGGYNPKKKGKFTGKEKPDEKKGLTDKQKKIIAGVAIGAAVAAGTAIAYKYGKQKVAKELSNVYANAGKEYFKAYTKANERAFELNKLSSDIKKSNVITESWIEAKTYSDRHLKAAPNLNQKAQQAFADSKRAYSNSELLDYIKNRKKYANSVSSIYDVNGMSDQDYAKYTKRVKETIASSDALNDIIKKYFVD